MLDRLQIVKQRFDEISDLIIQPDVISDQKRYVQLNQEYKSLKALADKRNEYIVVLQNGDDYQNQWEFHCDAEDAEGAEFVALKENENVRCISVFVRVR